MNLVEAVVVFFIAGILGLLAGVAIGDGSLKSQAIARGYAEYNATNGNWQWKESAK